MTIVQKLRSDLVPGASPGSSGQRPDSTMTMMVKGQMARLDLPASQKSSIVDTKEGKMFILLHKQKQVIINSLDDLKKIEKSIVSATRPGEDKTKPVIKKTGKVDTIRGYKCAEYEFTGLGDNPARIKCWITEDVDDSEMEVVRSFGGQMGGMFGFEGLQKPKGVIIRSEAKMNIAGREVTSESEVISIKREAVADSVFKIPDDYERVEMSAFNSAPRPAKEK
jgi:hypothetical protein